MFVKENFIDRLKKRIYFKLKNDIYNLNNCNIENNGEGNFRREFFKQLKKMI